MENILQHFLNGFLAPRPPKTMLMLCPPSPKTMLVQVAGEAVLQKKNFQHCLWGQGGAAKNHKEWPKTTKSYFDFCCNIFSMHGTSGGLLEPQLKNKRETRAEYKHRLKLTALAIPRSYIRKAVEDMKRRCEAVVEAEGWYFKE